MSSLVTPIGAVVKYTWATFAAPTLVFRKGNLACAWQTMQARAARKPYNIT